MMQFDLRRAGLRHALPLEVKLWREEWHSRQWFKIPDRREISLDRMVELLRETNSEGS